MEAFTTFETFETFKPFKTFKTRGRLYDGWKFISQGGDQKKRDTEQPKRDLDGNQEDNRNYLV